MIISVEDLRKHIDTTLEDSVLEAKLQALELLIRKHTNNNFQNRTFRMTADIVGGLFQLKENSLFAVGDTVQISESALNSGLYSILSVSGNTFLVEEKTIDEKAVLVTKVEYPADVVQCALNLLEWEINNRDKVGIQSETLSRHSVTYFAQDANNQVMGYPVALLGCLKAYRKVRC